ncbi:putative F-box/kelch-repeat protein-like [Capsicum annuum]|uniref:Apple domain-containing protein n=1 Tax=Capsicum annuum TaxID=4072 RepID=A0A2G2XXC9_CAPAN|nr:putative F-box/kelch-repeat protein-like [Capsicum annuum]KAF3658471.1 putative F-box/kelch-repeat protein-like [Capsicum annuum]PHT62145.1 hypothetical protein T459_34000 [Capsicum annuum]
MKNSYFSTELVSASSSNRTATLFDSGNLVLIDDLLGKRLWQSFDHPTDTFLPGMRMDDALKLTAWGVTQKDPTSGNYTFQLNQEGNSEYTIYQRTVLHWKGSAARTASANPFNFRELPSFVVSMLSNYSKKSDISSMLSYFNHTRLVMNSTGEIQLYGWDNKSSGWSQGKYNCMDGTTRVVDGLRDGQSRKVHAVYDWLAGIYTGGCSRKSDISCNKKSEFDTFLNMHSMKFEEPDTEYYAAKSEEDCRKECLSNCKCLAYSYFQVAETRRGTRSSCWIWRSELVNLQADYTCGFNLSVRVAITDIEAITRRNCKPCGPNIIPYPLSSQPNCGDPMYYSFSCDDLTGEASFKTLNGSYPVIDIDKENRTFVIQVHAENAGNTCDTKTQVVWLNQSLPFHPINRCFDGKLQNLSSGGVINEMQITWEPPPAPTCSTSADSEDWPYSSCNITEQGQRKCLCNQHYKWDDLVLNCTRGLLKDQLQLLVYFNLDYKSMSLTC